CTTHPPTPPTELTTEPRNRSHTNRIRRHRITSQAAGPTSSQIYTGNGTPPRGRVVSFVEQRGQSDPVSDRFSPEAPAVTAFMSLATVCLAVGVTPIGCWE